MPQTSKKRQTNGSETASLEIDGRLEIREMLVDYYVETRGRHRRTRMLVQESKFSLSATSDQLALMSPGNLLQDANVLGEKEGEHHGNSLVRIDMPGDRVAGDSADVLKEHPDSLTFSTIAAATTASNDESLHLACNYSDIVPVADLEKTGSSESIQPVWVGLPKTDTSQLQKKLTFDTLDIGIALSQFTPSDLTQSEPNQVHGIQPLQAELVATSDVIGCDFRLNHQEHTPAEVAGGKLVQEMDAIDAYSLIREGAVVDWDVMTVGVQVASDASSHVIHHCLAIPQAMIRPEQFRVSSIDAMANLSKSDQSTGRIEFVLPRFTEIEGFVYADPMAREDSYPKLSLLQLNRGRRFNRSEVREVIQDDFLPVVLLPTSCAPACGVAVVTTIGLSVVSSILKSLSRITARPGYLGSVEGILQSTTQELLTPASWPLSSLSPVQMVGIESLRTWNAMIPPRSTVVVVPPAKLEREAMDEMQILNPTKIFGPSKASRMLPAAA